MQKYLMCLISGYYCECAQQQNSGPDKAWMLHGEKDSMSV